MLEISINIILVTLQFINNIEIKSFTVPSYIVIVLDIS